MEPKSLWGDLPLDATIQTPFSILREQATLLTKATNGLLEGQVISENTGIDMKLRLRIVAPMLGQYKFTVLAISHKIFIYPLDAIDHVNGLSYKCDTDARFMEVVEKTLTSAAVHKAIASLLAQSKASDESEKSDGDNLPF